MLSRAEHDLAAEQLSSLRSTALSLHKHLSGKVPDQDLGHVRVLLNVISQIHLQLDGLYDQEQDAAGNPYVDEVVWVAER
jgi:hypothetical protein